MNQSRLERLLFALMVFAAFGVFALFVFFGWPLDTVTLLAIFFAMMARIAQSAAQDIERH